MLITLSKNSVNLLLITIIYYILLTYTFFIMYFYFSF